MTPEQWEQAASPEEWALRKLVVSFHSEGTANSPAGLMRWALAEIDRLRAEQAATARFHYEGALHSPDEMDQWAVAEIDRLRAVTDKSGDR